MMILRTTAPSPFGRKVKIAIELLGLGDQVEVQSADTVDPGDSIRTQNPLGKIPALVLEDGRVVFDSRVIIEYLDGLSDAATLIPQGDERIDILTRHALADGLMDAALLQVYEKRFRPEDIWHPDWLDYQAGKVTRALDTLEADPPARDGAITIAHIATACALGYLDFRFDGTWRASYPGLVAWLEDFAGKVPAFGKTTPPPA